MNVSVNLPTSVNNIPLAIHHKYAVLKGEEELMTINSIIILKDTNHS